MSMTRILAFILLSLFVASINFSSQAQSSKHNLMPAPASLQFGSGRLAVNDAFAVAVKGHSDARLTEAIDRMTRRLEARTGFTFARGVASDAAKATLVIQCQAPGKAIPAVDEDESYSLEVSSAQSVMNAPTVVGALRGLETFLQLLSGDKDGHFIPAVVINDKPRFPWRGLMIDIGRHWQPMEVIKRNLDGMAAVKLNVLHLHITEDQGFRVESKKFPELHQMGSDGNFYTQDQMREIIEYARMRGIRVVPEFDMPGHTTAWFVSHPELASAPGPYRIERRWGIFDPAMDPSNEQVYTLLDGFLGEMAALFPDAYLHIGGDENNGKQWNANPKIQEFVREKGLKDNHGLQAYFNKRLSAIITKYGKKVIGWDEVLHPDLPKDIVIQSWRGQASLADAAKKGYAGILSNGYYIDLIEPASRHYLNDPVPENTPLTAEEQKLILGGEATMWSEWTSPETIDSRIWPRTAAIAERFWSPREVRNLDDMYRRLAIVSVQLEDVGLLHKKNPPAMLRRWLGGAYANNEEVVRLLAEFVSLVEPVKGYTRGRMQKATQQTPLTKLADTAQPDSEAARNFARLVDDFITVERVGDNRLSQLVTTVVNWSKLNGTIRGMDLAASAPNVNEALPLLQNLMSASNVGLDALSALERHAVPSPEWRAEKLAVLEAAAKPSAAVELMIIQPIKELVIAAAEQEKRKTMSAEEWKKMIKEAAAPKRR